MGTAGCATTASSSERWSGDLARTYQADVSMVVEAATKAVRDIGMGMDSRQIGEMEYVIEATRRSSSNFGGERVQLTGMSVHVRDMGDVGTNLQIRIPEQDVSYASQRNDSYAQRQARRILTLLDQQFQESSAVQ